MPAAIDDVAAPEAASCGCGRDNGPAAAAGGAAAASTSGFCRGCDASDTGDTSSVWLSRCEMAAGALATPLGATILSLWPGGEATPLAAAVVFWGGAGPGGAHGESDDSPLKGDTRG